METGTVAKVDGNRVLWKSDKTGEFIIDLMSKMEKIEIPAVPVEPRPDLELRDEPDDPAGQVCTIPYHCGQGYLCCYSGGQNYGGWYGIHEGCNTFDDLNTCYPCPTGPALNELSDYEYEHCTGHTWFEENAWVEEIHNDPYVGFDNDDYFIHDFSGVGYNYGSEIPNPECDYEIPICTHLNDSSDGSGCLTNFPCVYDGCYLYTAAFQASVNHGSSFETNNIDIINLAIEQANEGGGGTICLPEGTFIITSHDEYEMITLKSNVVLKGQVDDNGDPTTYLYFYGGILSDDNYYSYLNDSGLLDISEISKVPYIGTGDGGHDVVLDPLDTINYEQDITVGTNILTITGDHNIQIGDLLSITIKDGFEEVIQGHNYFYDDDEAFTDEINEFIASFDGSVWDDGAPYQKYYRKVKHKTKHYA